MFLSFWLDGPAFCHISFIALEASILLCLGARLEWSAKTPSARKDDASPFELAEGLLEQINSSIQRGCSGLSVEKDEPAIFYNWRKGWRLQGEGPKNAESFIEKGP